MNEPLDDAVTTPPPAQPAKRRRWGRWLLLSLLILFAVLAGAFWYALRWIDTDDGHRWIARQLVPLGIKAGAIEGSLWSELVLRDVEVTQATAIVKLDFARLKWRPSALWHRQLQVDALQLGALSVKTLPDKQPKPKTPPPEELTLPLRVTVASLQLARFELVDTPVVLRDLSADLHSDGRNHVLNVRHLATPRGDLDAELTLAGRAPIGLTSRLDYEGVVDGHAVTAKLGTRGTLRGLEIDLKMQSDAMQAQAALTVDAFAEQTYAMLQGARISARQIDPAALWPGLPSARLDIDANVDPTASGAAGTLRVFNHLAGKPAQHQIPVHSVEGQFALSEHWLNVKALKVRLPGGGELELGGEVDDGRVNARLDSRELNLAELVDGMPATRISGGVDIGGALKAPTLRGALKDAVLDASAQFETAWAQEGVADQLLIRSIELVRGASTLKGKGEYTLSAQRFAAELEASRFNPADYAKVPQGDISARIKAKGALKPTLALELEYGFQPSRFNQQTLAGEGVLKVGERRVHDARFWLALGDNRVDAQGAYGRAGDALKLKLALDALGQLGPGFAGTADGDAAVSGVWPKANIEAALSVRRLTTPFGVALGRAEVSARASADRNAPLLLSVDASDLTAPELQLDRVGVKLAGTQGRHTLAASAAGRYADGPLSLLLNAAGGLSDQQIWQGEVSTLDFNGPVTLAARAPFKLTAGADRAELGHAEFNIENSLVRLEQLSWRDGALNTAGKADGIDVAHWLKWAKIDAGIQTDLRLDATWDLALGKALDGKIRVQRSGGDVSRVVGKKRHAFDLRVLALDVTAAASRIQAKADLESGWLGDVHASAGVLFDPATLALAPGSDVDLALKGSLPDLARVGSLVAEGVTMGGRLDLDISRRGPLYNGSATGQINGKQLLIADADSGIKLEGGELAIQLSDRMVELKRLYFKGGKGHIEANGRVDLSVRDAPSAVVSFDAKQLLVLNRPDMQIVISGNGEVKHNPEGLAVTGKVVVDRGNIEYRGGSDTPTLASDVVVLGKEPRSHTTSSPARLAIDVDLGNDFRFRGYGLEAELSGAVNVRSKPGGDLAAHGVVKIDEGTYKAYGQNLEIDRGVLSFSGPIDNPSLDILAVRRGGAVEAGVQVRGVAQRPDVKLYSDPNVPDAEKLSWMLFGHGTDGMDKGDSAVFVQLLNAVLTEGDPNNGLTDQLLGTIGIDEVGYSSEDRADGTSSGVVTVGKRLTNRVKIALEKSFDGLSDAVALTMQLSRSWAVVTRVGTDSSEIDALYSISFD
ncbi:translocation/assembly module TamB domain-containing protein [Chitinibacteraceae bacterium HSL-7]